MEILIIKICFKDKGSIEILNMKKMNNEYD